MATRGDDQIGANLTGLGPDDPDANFYENYGGGSPRNSSAYCNEKIQEADRSPVG
jgi:peptide/nickel transport system substrate-binding protein